MKRSSQGRNEAASSDGSFFWGGYLRVTVLSIDGFVDTVTAFVRTRPYVQLQLGNESQGTSCKDNVKADQMSDTPVNYAAFKN